MVLVNLAVKVKVSVNKNDHHNLEKNDVSAELTWAQFFDDNEIIVDPKMHYIKGSVHTAYLNDQINQYYKNFSRQMASYKVTLCRKPSHLIKHEKELEEAIQKSLVTENCVREFKRTIIPKSLEQDGKIPHSSKRVKLNTLPNERNPKAEQLGHVHIFSDAFVEEHEMRGEDTQEGNIVTDAERNVTDDIRLHLRSRVSNHDILKVRSELKKLKLERNYFHLTRLIPFTAGLLENTFLLDQE